MNKAIIQAAAVTARLLGYKILVSQSEGKVRKLVIWEYDTGAAIVSNWKAAYPFQVRNFPSDTEALGHFLVRLHMEKHYGIYTPHYWESHLKQCQNIEQLTGRAIR